MNAKLAVGLSPRTVKHILVTLGGALAVALKDGQIPRNVAAHVDPPRVPQSELQVFNGDEARAFLDAARSSRFEAAYTAAVAVGLRQGEIIGLKWEDVNLETGVMTIRKALQTKSARSRRTIELPAVCVSTLARYKSDQAAVSFTMQTYAHVLAEVQKQVATKMDEILMPKPVATRVATKPASGLIQ
jgi:integrase